MGEREERPGDLEKDQMLAFLAHRRLKFHAALRERCGVSVVWWSLKHTNTVQWRQQFSITETPMMKKKKDCTETEDYYRASA